MPNIINDPQVTSSSSDKGKFFAINFISSSSLDNKVNPLCDFSLIEISQSLCSISAWEDSKLIKRFDVMKATGLDKISVVKNLRLELSPIVAKLFNYCPNDKRF